jgi:hypothetical protein
MMRAEAFGPFGSHRAIEVILTSTKNSPENAELMPPEGAADTTDYGSGTGQAGVRLLTWHEVR